MHLHNRRNCHGLHGDNTVYMYMRVKLEFLDVHLNVFSVLTVTLFSKFGMMTTYFKQEHFGELNHIGITVAPLHIGHVGSQCRLTDNLRKNMCKNALGNTSLPFFRLTWVS